MKSDGKFAYSLYGVNCTEVEVDVLTGAVEVIRSANLSVNFYHPRLMQTHSYCIAVHKFSC